MDPEAKPLVSDGALGARWTELSVSAPTRATFTQGEPHIRSGLGFEFAPGLTRDGSWRLFASVAGTVGHWGDERHGQVMVEPGLGLKFSLLPDELQLIDVYGIGSWSLVEGFFNLAPGRSSEAGSVLGGGLGLRVFRAFSVELTGHWTYALDTRFTASDGGTSQSIPDVGLSVDFDLCSLGLVGLCDRTPIKQASQDATCAIYTKANTLCGSVLGNAQARKDLCQDAVDALSFSETKPPVLARDALETFLQDLATAEASTPRASQVKDLVATNACLMDWRSCGRRRECLLGQQGQTPDTRRVYAPYVLEVLGALGCNADGSVAKDCKYVCEVADSAGDTCVAPRH